jgi:hypothetical protein
MELEIVLVASRDILAGEEILVSIPDHRRQFILQGPSYIENRTIELALGKRCVIRRIIGNVYRPFMVEIVSRVGSLFSLWCYTTGTTDMTVRAYMGMMFHPGWSCTTEEKHETIVYAQKRPCEYYRPYMIQVTLKKSDILAHDVSLDGSGYIADDLLSFICYKFALPSFVRT